MTPFAENNELNRHKSLGVLQHFRQALFIPCHCKMKKMSEVEVCWGDQRLWRWISGVEWRISSYSSLRSSHMTSLSWRREGEEKMLNYSLRSLNENHMQKLGREKEGGEVGVVEGWEEGWRKAVTKACHSQRTELCVDLTWYFHQAALRTGRWKRAHRKRVSCVELGKTHRITKGSKGQKTTLSALLI